MKILGRTDVRSNEFVWIECHCGDKWALPTSTADMITCLNGHKGHFPTMHRKFLEESTRVSMA